MSDDKIRRGLEMTRSRALALTPVGDGQDRKRKRGCQGGESFGTTSGNSTPAGSDVGSSPSTLANTQPVQEASSSRLPTIRARGKRQLGELYL